jgi:hypothetical protein
MALQGQELADVALLLFEGLLVVHQTVAWVLCWHEERRWAVN